MLTAFVDGRNVGPAGELGRLLEDFTARHVEVELRDDAGRTLGRLVPAEPLCPWNPALDEVEAARRVAEGCMTLDVFLATAPAAANDL